MTGMNIKLLAENRELRDKYNHMAGILSKKIGRLEHDVKNLKVWADGVTTYHKIPGSFKKLQTTFEANFEENCSQLTTEKDGEENIGM